MVSTGRKGRKVKLNAVYLRSCMFVSGKYDRFSLATRIQVVVVKVMGGGSKTAVPKGGNGRETFDLLAV